MLVAQCRLIFAFMLLVGLFWAGPAHAGGFRLTTLEPDSRLGATATALTGGKVVIDGGYPGLFMGGVETIRIFDPKTEQFKIGPKIGQPSFEDEGYAPLQSGGLLVAGGETLAGPGVTVGKKAGVFVPEGRGRFVEMGSMAHARALPGMATLKDGRVLVVGGDDRIPGAGEGSAEKSAELFDPATGRFSLTGAPLEPFVNPSIVTLNSGKVLVFGGELTETEQIPAEQTAAEIYDPKTGTFSPAASPRQNRNGSMYTKLKDGRVLVVGATSDPTSAEIYDPATNEWSPTGSMHSRREETQLVALPDGTVLVPGGMGSPRALRSAEIFDPKSNRFRLAGSMTYARRELTATALPSGDVLIAGGGYDLSNAWGRAEIYSFRPRCQLRYPRNLAAAKGSFVVKVVAKTGRCRAKLTGAKFQLRYMESTIDVDRSSRSIKRGRSWRVRIFIGNRNVRRAQNAKNRDAVALVRFTINKRPWFALVGLH